MEKPVKELFKDFIKNRCSDSEIEQVRKLIKLGEYEKEWQQAIEETEKGFSKQDYSFIKVDETRIFRRIQQSAGLHFASSKWVWFACAASLLLVAAVGLLFSNLSAPTPQPELVSVSKPAAKTMKHKWIKLPDGTSVQLNNDSHLEYPASFAGQSKREVKLIGEAYFDVKHDSAHPFVIYTGKIRTTVLGTAFNIKAYKADKEVTVTVTRGKVIVQDEKQTLAVLTPNQQLTWNNQKSLTAKTKVNAETVIAWKKSDLIMDDITLEEASKMISERYGVQVHFKNEKVKNCRFTAAFLNRNEVGQVLSVLGDITGASLTLKDHIVTIDGPGC